jgi:2-polyprenyl-3-methyl-5-hydroxy-6-metoxy-1,4-benzoquinol methylase
VHLGAAAWAAVRDNRRRREAEMNNTYRASDDPFGYKTTWGERHLELVQRLFDLATQGAAPPRALDIGCGEGWAAERLAAQCREMLAVDISPLALERARIRCAGSPNVRFAEWELLSGPPLGKFDLVLLMSVLEEIMRPADTRQAARRVRSMVAPGGSLIVTTTKQAEIVETSQWTRILPRGSRGIDRLLLATGSLERRAQEESDTHVLTLYQRHA